MNLYIRKKPSRTSFHYTLRDSFSGYMGKYRVNKKSTSIIFQVSTHLLYTSQLSATIQVLKHHLPSIFRCQCFNDDHIPFGEEVHNTELGHLFEHILLEFLCLEKLELGSNFADYSGVTNWNWQRDPRGKFRIKINIGKAEEEIFYTALHKSVNLLNNIIEQSYREYDLDTQDAVPLFPVSFEQYPFPVH